MGESRRNWLRRCAGIAALAVLPPALANKANKAEKPLPLLEVWKDPQCGCCQDWIAHMERNGFRVKVNQTGNSAARARLGMPQQFGSCHTGLVEGYVLEGHVPAAEVQRLLRTRPAALGLAVPGMPIGSPGMDGPVYGGKQDQYAVLLVQKDGGSRVFQRYPL